MYNVYVKLYWLQPEWSKNLVVEIALWMQSYKIYMDVCMRWQWDGKMEKKRDRL